MKWTIKRIDEADFGCEERMPGEPLMVLVSLESEDFREMQLEVADEWLIFQKLDVGDEWPEDIDATDNKYEKQNQWMSQYMDAIDAMDDNEAERHD